MKKQSYSNHKRYDPFFHIVFSTLVLAILIASIINFINSLDEPDRILPSVILVAISLFCCVAYYFIRLFAVKLQDRIIRAEENFRHLHLTGQPLDQKLHINQIIALRFSPDNEYIDLCKEAVEKKLSSEEIKKSISRWKGDYHRV